MGAGIEFLSWNGNTESNDLPRRPSTDDLGGDDLQNDELAPPGPDDPDATAWDAMVREIVALAKTTAAAKATITFSGGAPQWELFSAPGSAVTTGDLTLTDAGTGITEITWPENTFPPASAWPEVSLHGDGWGWTENITNGVRIKTKNAAGELANIPFTVTIN